MSLVAPYEALLAQLTSDLSEIESMHNEMTSRLSKVDAPAVPDDVLRTLDQVPAYTLKLKTLKKLMSQLDDRTEKLRKRVESVKQRKQQKDDKEKEKWAAVSK
jgi:predicted RNase H-like nuclease (RuvC/YqgF family)